MDEKALSQNVERTAFLDKCFCSEFAMDFLFEYLNNTDMQKMLKKVNVKDYMNFKLFSLMTFMNIFDYIYEDMMHRYEDEQTEYNDEEDNGGE